MERVGTLRGEWFLCLSAWQSRSSEATYAVVADMALDLFPADGLPQLAYELAARYPACCGAKRGCVLAVPLPGRRPRRLCTRSRGTRGGVGGVEVLEEGGGGEVGLCEEGECGVCKVALEEVEVHEDVDLHAAQLHRVRGGGREGVAPRRLRGERRQHRVLGGVRVARELR